MTLYSPLSCALSHGVRIVIFEKGILTDIEYYEADSPPLELLEFNPGKSTPTLIDRDLVLYDPRIIMEYLDERFPHPPLYQMDPVSRASARMIIKRIDQDWFRLFEEIKLSGEKKAARAKKMLKESLMSSMPVFAATPYFMSSDFSLVDCALIPLLIRLHSIGIDLPEQANPIRNYANRIMQRKGFISSLNSFEQDLLETPL